MAEWLNLIHDTGKTPRELVFQFIESQKQHWNLAAANFEGLERVEVKHFFFDGFRISVQFNPERMLSTSSKTDQASIAARPCFLCTMNRPKEQDEIDFMGDMKLLINPFPIFKLHLTIVSTGHVPQRFLVNAPKMLKLAKALPQFTIVYNGPECGASAPDHFHFQAGESSLMPISEEFNRLRHTTQLLFSSPVTKVYAFGNYLRKMISIETESASDALEVIDIYYRNFHAMQNDKPEPLMNVLCWYDQSKWIIHLFPRKAHRPRQYFADGTDQILISPGSVDFGGLFITPRREDFEKIGCDDIIDILDQVCLDKESFIQLTTQIRKDLAAHSFNSVSPYA